jgi:HEAT repeat protein
MDDPEDWSAASPVKECLMIPPSETRSATWNAFANSAVLAALVTVAGCGRAAPTPSPQAASVSAKNRAQEMTPTDAPAAGIRDDGVQQATYLAPAGVPAPRSEKALAAEALSRIGPPAVPMLVEALKSPDGDVRRQACAVLMRMGPDAKEAVPDLVMLLDDEDQELRKMAATALGRIGPDAAPAVPALMRAMFEGEPQPSSNVPRRLPQ